MHPPQTFAPFAEGTGPTLSCVIFLPDVQGYLPADLGQLP